MIRRGVVISLPLLSALLFCSFAAESAFAIERTGSNNTTAFTCVKGGGNRDFKDEHCDEKVTIGTGNYGHVAIALSTYTEFDMTNDEVTKETKDIEPVTLEGIIGLVKVHVHCNKLDTTEKSTIHNEEPEKGVHIFAGTVELELSDCDVQGPQPEKCDVKEPIEFAFEVDGVDLMQGPTAAEKDAMGVEFKGHGEKETVGTIEFTNKSGSSGCVLNGAKAKLQGRFVATRGPGTEADQETKESGSTLVVTPKFGMETLKIGGNAAWLETIATGSMAGNGNAIALTTTT